MPSSEALTDDYLAQLLAKDAKDKTIKYSGHGLQSLLPKRPTTNAPKPNTRFLKNIIKETDNHNAALSAKEHAEARARFRGIDGNNQRHRQQREYEGRRPHRDGHSSKRRKTDGDRDYGRLERHEECSSSSHRQRHEDRRGNKRGRHHEDSSTSSEPEGSHRRRRSRSTSPETDRERRRKPKTRHRSRSPRKSHSSHHRQRRRRHSSTPSTSPPPLSRTSLHSPPDNRTYSPPSPAHSTSDSDPLATIIGPLPPSVTSTLSNPFPRGRGSIRTHSNIDTHFAPSYDPTLDIRPTTPSSTDDWDNALEALRDRVRWQKAGGERLRAAGFTDEEVAKWEKSGSGGGREERVEDVKWKGRGEGREWDRGKVVGEDGAVGVEVEWGRLQGT